MKGKSVDAITKSTTNHSRILKYWKSVPNDVWKSFNTDSGEITCWICGKFYDDADTSSWKNYVESWKKYGLQRMHIVPRQLGGENKPSNICLGCPECHDLAPDTKDRDVFFEWVKNQNIKNRTIRQLDEMFEPFGLKGNYLVYSDYLWITQSVYEYKNGSVLHDKLKPICESYLDFTENKIGIHVNQTKRGTVVKQSSIVGMFVNWWKNGNNCLQDMFFLNTCKDEELNKFCKNNIKQQREKYLSQSVAQIGEKCK